MTVVFLTTALECGPQSEPLNSHHEHLLKDPVIPSNVPQLRLLPTALSLLEDEIVTPNASRQAFSDIQRAGLTYVCLTLT